MALFFVDHFCTNVTLSHQWVSKAVGVRKLEMSSKGGQHSFSLPCCLVCSLEKTHGGRPLRETRMDRAWRGDPQSVKLGFLSNFTPPSPGFLEVFGRQKAEHLLQNVFRAKFERIFNFSGPRFEKLKFVWEVFS